MKPKRFLILFTILALLAPLVASLIPGVALALDRTQTQKVIKTVVKFFAANKSKGKDGGFDVIWTGSGTIISPDGLILTNCHVACSNEQTGNPEDKFDTLIIAMTVKSDQPPQPTYIGEVVQYSLRGSGLDLAVVRIVSTLDGKPVDTAKLNLPYLPLGDSDELEINDTLTIFGYPGIGGDTITATEGKVSGFTSLQGIAGRAWIKTDATIAGGNSGGTAVNDAGELIGVPTQLGCGNESCDYTDCRRLQDTNGDGRIDENDTCIPTGGFINAVRPINLAKPYIEAAAKGLATPTQPTPPTQPNRPAGKAGVSGMFFAPDVTAQDQPTQVVQSFPTGTKLIVFFFDFANLAAGTPWQVQLTLDGVLQEGLWAMESWSGPADGTSWVSLTGDPLPDGAYEFAIVYDGAVLGSAATSVGGKAQSGPTLSNIVFSGGGQEGNLLPAGIDEIEAVFDYANVNAQTQWSYTWFLDGEEVAGDNGPAFTKSAGQFSLSLTADEGFPAGDYRLELYIAGKLAAASNLSLAGGGSGAGGEGPIGPITFAEGADRNDKPVKPHKAGEAFASGTGEIFGFFDWQGMQDGWPWVSRWYIDGELVIESPGTWAAGASGTGYWLQIYSDSGLPDGEYTLEIAVQGQVVQGGSAVIGKGGVATPTPKPTGDVQVTGYIRDAKTGKGIPGALFLVLQPGITTADFEWTDEEVYAVGEADKTGYFELSALLERGEAYSLLIGAQGYVMISQDGVEVTPDTPDVVEMEIQLQKAR